jgi:DNA gyrase subunit A
MKKFKLSEIQAKAILDMRLQRLTGLERSKVESEYKETIKLIEKLKSILRSKELQKELIHEELLKLKEKYGDERRTLIIEGEEDFSVEDLIAEEDVVITITHNGFIKRYPVSGYRRQSRGGKGITAAVTKDDDFIEHMFVASTHHYIIFFTDKGRAYSLKVHEIPEGSRASRGRSISHLIKKDADEKITAFVAVKEFSENLFVTMVTKMGLVKKVPLMEFATTRKTGLIAITLNRGDRLVDARLTDGGQDLIIGTKKGMAIRFNEKDIRPMGRQAAGVRGIKLEKDDEVIGMIAVKRSGTTILVVTEKGFGKRSDLNDYRITHRGGKGIITVKVNDKTGDMVAIKEVLDNDDVMIVTTKGYLIRQHIKDIKIMSRQAQGVKLIKLNHGDTIASVASVVTEEEEE